MVTDSPMPAHEEALLAKPFSESSNLQDQSRQLLENNSNQTPGNTQSAFAGGQEVYSLAAAAALPAITLTDHMPTAAACPENRSVVVVDKSHHQTHILQMEKGKVEDVLTVPNATGQGTSGKVTPEGRFHVVGKEENPWWYPPPSIGGKPVPPGPHNPLGPRKIRTDAYGGRVLMHGTNRPDQIGTNASHGCIRHQNNDIKRIYPLVEPGDAVYIVKDFNGAKIKSEDFSPRKH